jgi:hypothetical protein
MLIGDTNKMLSGIAMSAVHKSNCRRNGLPLDKAILFSNKISLKHIPRKLTRLIKAMWGTRCLDHNKPLTRTHLREHGLIIDPLALLKASQG